jgi:hypothetical protein
MEFFRRLRRQPAENFGHVTAKLEVAETIFSSGASRVTVPDELIEMVQYSSCHQNNQLDIYFNYLIKL